MDAHPDERTLHAYGLGRLDDDAAGSVQRHLESCPDCRRRVAAVSSDSFLARLRDAEVRPGSMVSETGGLSLPGGGRGMAAPPPAETMPPGLADHPDYEILRELGRGGMGVVYLAQNSLMGRPEVLKVVGGHLISRPGVGDRFLREIRSAARLHHPNIVAAHAALRLGDSLVLAMEFVEGLDLARIVKARGPMPVANACNYVHQAALGLQHAHERGMVHRDIKPANLILAREGKKAVVKVLDFGLAKVTSEGQVDRGLTREGQMLGTPDFIAPEQIRDAQSADIRADIYSLGCTLYYLLTGGPPFGGDNLWDLYQAHFSMDAAPLNLARPEIPVELAALVAKMMAKDPAKRFQTPGEVAQALLPFFKQANAADKRPKTDLSQAGQTYAAKTSPGAVAAPTRPATNGERPADPARDAVETTVAEPRWERLIETREEEDSIAAARAVEPARRPPWVWLAAAAGVLMLGLFAAGLGGVFKVKTPEGMIVLEGVPKEAEILVDGGKISFTWPGGGSPVEVRAVPGQRKIEVKKDGFTTFVKELTVKANGSEEVTVRLEPLAAPRPAKGESESPKATVGENTRRAPDTVPSGPVVGETGTSGFVPLFNGKDLSGWAGDVGDYEVVGGVLSCKPGRRAVIYEPAERSDFVARVEFRLTPGAESGLLMRYPGRGDFAYDSMCEIQVLDDSHPSYAGIDPRCLHGSAWGMAAAKRGYVRPPGEWNVQEVTVRGSTVKVELNGAVVLDADLASIRDFEQGRPHPGKDRTSGHFGVQSGLGMNRGNVDYRKIEIRDLPPLGSPSPTESKPAAPLATGSGFRPLFNGKDLAGWTIDSGPRSAWRVEDGNLVATGPGDWRRSGFVLSDREVSNFILRFEFRPSPGSNSGITFRATPDEFAGRLAHPLQIELFDRDAPDIKNGSFIWSTSIRNSDMLPPDRPLELLPGGAWNRAEVEVQGDSLRVAINGNRILAADLNRLADRPDANPALKRRSGHIGFQSHTGTVRFRNIELKELPPAADSLQPGSVWVAEPGHHIFTIVERQKERFKARFEVGWQVREVNGTIQDGRLRWLAGNVKAISGNPGGDNEGEIQGDEIAMAWSDPGGPIRGRFTLRLRRPAPASPTGTRYPADARGFRGKRYKVFPQQLTWHDARARCQELGGRLATVTSGEENRFLTSLVKEKGLGGAWLGATDERVEGRWVWVDGTALRYSNWDIPQKQPNNKQGIEHYMVLLTRFDGTWCDHPNDGRQEHPGFICQWD